MALALIRFISQAPLSAGFSQRETLESKEEGEPESVLLFSSSCLVAPPADHLKGAYYNT